MKVKLLENLLTKCYNNIESIYNNNTICYKINNKVIDLSYGYIYIIPDKLSIEDHSSEYKTGFNIAINGTLYTIDIDSLDRITAAKYITLFENTVNRFRQDLLHKVVRYN